MSDNKNSIPRTMGERLVNGLFKENPTFVLLLGMCPTLAVTTSAMNGLGMGLTTLVVLALSNLLISLLRKVIPDKIRIPAFIVIIASFVTMAELLLKAYLPSLFDALGIYIPLIVVNCIILGRAEAYAYSNGVIASLFDGLGMGLGFTLALTLIGAFRELLGTGKIFDTAVMPSSYVPVSIFVMAPGAFFVLALLTAIQNFIKDLGTKRGKDMSKIQSGCGGDCMACDKDCKKPEETVKAEEKKPEAIEEPEEKKPEAAGEPEEQKPEADEEPEEKTAEDKKPEKAEKPEKPVEKKRKKFKRDKVFKNIEKAEEINMTKENGAEEAVEPAPAKDTAEEAAVPEPVTAAPAEPVPEPEPVQESVPEPEVLPEPEPVEEASAPETEAAPEPEAKPEPAHEAVTAEDEAKNESEDIEFFDIEELKEKAMKRAQAKKKKRMSVDKAKLMLSKAEESLKEGEGDD